MKKENEDMAILVYSCWKNRGMWPIFSQLFEKYWRECPYQIVLVTDAYKHINDKIVFDRIVVKDDTWAIMMKEAVKLVDTKYVMLWMDDYLLCDYVSNSEIASQLKRASDKNAFNLRLIESPACDGIYHNDANVGYYASGKAYSFSTQIGIWNTKYLMRIIKDEWSPWEFERVGSLTKRCLKQPLLVSLDYTFPYEEAVRKGKWMREGVKLCKRNKIDITVSNKPVMTDMEMAKIYFYGAVIGWNPAIVVGIQNFVCAMRKSIQSLCKRI